MKITFRIFIPICYVGPMDKRRNILNAALKLFVEQGEQATSMKLIAKEANCGIGTMYNYFKSKDALINDLYIELKTKLSNNSLKIMDNSLPVKQQFINVWLKTIEYLVLHPLEYRFLQIFSHSPKISQESTEEVYKQILPLLEIYEKGKKEGIIKNEDTLRLVIFTNGAITASAVSNPGMDTDEKIAIVLMAWDAIKS
jgi:AcrR family transcriptional regulator